MNNKINAIPIEDILFWDMEVVRESDELLPNSDAFHLFQHKHRNRETDELPTEQETIELYRRKAGLSSTHNKIVCLSMGFVKQGKIHVKSLTGSQFDIITEFSKVLSKGYIPCGWNIIKFDFPTLRIKAFQEGIIDYAPEQFNDAGKKEWAMSEIKYNVNMIDLMIQYQGTSYMSAALAEACYVLNVPTPKDDIDGSQVSDVFYAEGVERIATYCEKDVVACIHILQRMRGEDLTTEIVYKNGDDKKEIPVLTKLNRENYLSDSIKAEILKRLKSKKIAQKSRDKVEDILYSIYVKSSFSTEDSTATDDDETMQNKEREIKTLLDEYFKK